MATGDKIILSEDTNVTVVDNLTSTSTTNALSANQGRLLHQVTDGSIRAVIFKDCTFSGNDGDTITVNGAEITPYAEGVSIAINEGSKVSYPSNIYESWHVKYYVGGSLVADINCPPGENTDISTTISFAYGDIIKRVDVFKLKKDTTGATIFCNMHIDTNRAFPYREA